jgi:hypothetical protein
MVTVCDDWIVKNKPQPQVAPTSHMELIEWARFLDEVKKCEHDRILSAIKDDEMAEKLSSHCSDCRKVINAYRATLMERIGKGTL